MILLARMDLRATSAPATSVAPCMKQSGSLRDPILDLHHNLLERALALGERAARDATASFVVEGVRFVCSALSAGWPMERIFVSRRLLTSGAGKKAIKQAAQLGIPITYISPACFRHISHARRASGLLAIASQQWADLSQLSRARAPALWLGVRHLQTTGNLGTIIRTAEATCAAGVVLLGKTLDPFDAASVRASMGAQFHVPMVRTTHAALREAQAVRVLGTSASAPHAVWETELCTPGATVVLLGHERHGLTDEERAMSEALIGIPMGGKMSSLNAGVAASLVLYEAWRQRACLPQARIN